VMTWEYAERAGVSEQTAKNRLRVLYEKGMATRHRERGAIGWTYEAKER
jgi:DeoR/GlpR family transcriptional regulator of sugar metabolism